MYKTVGYKVLPTICGEALELVKPLKRVWWVEVRKEIDWIGTESWMKQ